MSRDSCPILIVSLPKTFSSAVMGILSHHPGIFSAPELHVFQADDLLGLIQKDREMAYSTGNKASLTAGLLACMRELNLIDRGESENVRSLEELPNYTYSELTAMITKAASPRRLIIKSTLIGLDRRALKRFRDIEPYATIIMLVRHPIAWVESMLRTSNLSGCPQTPRSLVEIYLYFTETLYIPWIGGASIVQAEQIITAPRTSLAALLRALEIPTSEAFLEKVFTAREPWFLSRSKHYHRQIMDDEFAKHPELRIKDFRQIHQVATEWRISQKQFRRLAYACGALGYEVATT